MAKITDTNILRICLTVLFGALPASGLCMFAGFGALLGIRALARGEPFGILFLSWGLAGILGTFSLWLVAFRAPTRKIAVGLAIGLVGIMPLVYLAITSISSSRGLADIAIRLLAISPSLVATYWLYQARPLFFAIRLRNAR